AQRTTPETSQAGGRQSRARAQDLGHFEAPSNGEVSNGSFAFWHDELGAIEEGAWLLGVHGDRDGAHGRQAKFSQRDLQSGGARIVAHGEVGRGVRRRVEGSRRRNASR